MASTTETVFSEFFLDQLGIKPEGSETTTLIDCVGKLSEEMEITTITKKCRGRVKKNKAKPTGGTVTISAHMPYKLYLSVYGMDADTSLATGVYGYGSGSVHKQCLVTAKVLDEDNNVEYKTYPNATATTKSVEIDDDNTEVAMVEIEYTLGVDDYEQFFYQALADDITEAITSSWMSDWTRELVSATTAAAASAEAADEPTDEPTAGV